jgi:hypothetical protein
MNIIQDWKPVILSKTKSKNKIVKEEKEKKEEEDTKLKFFDKSFCLKIQQLRSLNKWTRKETAQKLNMTENDLAFIENGKDVKYNGEFVNKCKRLFGNFTY